MYGLKPNPTLKFAPSGRWDAPSARPLAARYAAKSITDFLPFVHAS
jgi:hypothetical protein